VLDIIILIIYINMSTRRYELGYSKLQKKS